MATEQSTIVVYAITGSTRRFHVPFEYLSRQFVVVTLLGVGRTVLTLGSDYRFISLNEIETTVAYGGADGNNFIEIRRVTSATDRLVEFVDGSVLRSRDMNVSAIQTIHIAEEARNLASDTLASDDDGNLDARGRRLVNLGSAVNPKDAMTYEQVTGWSNSALHQANRSQTEANKSAASAAAALASQNAAAASQSAALASQNAAAASQSATKTSENNAKTSENNAKTSENNAKTSENNAKTSENNAKTSETAAKNAQSQTHQHANKAKDWAENPVNKPVEGDMYSAKHWASVAKGNANGENYLTKSGNLSELSNAEQARRNLGLGTAATWDVGTGSGNVMEVGAFGVGGVMGLGSSTVNPTGFYYSTASAAVNGGGAFFMDVKYAGLGTDAYQAFRLSNDTYTNRFYLHSGRGGGELGLNPPVEILHTDNILHTTGQSTLCPMTQKAVTDALAANKKYVDDLAIGVGQTWQAVTDALAANKKYVDDSAIGVGQTWQDVAGSRGQGTIFTNTTGRPIQVFLSGNTLRFTVNGVYFSTGAVDGEISAIVPNGATYSATANTPFTTGRWMELR